MSVPNKEIWKFPLQFEECQLIEMPFEAKTLSVDTQQESPFIWALVNPERPKVNRLILMYGTGHPIPAANNVENIPFIGTFQSDMFVFHVFDGGHR